MADGDDGVLPAYIEEDDEEAAAAKQERRQKSQKPREKMPWEVTSPEEQAMKDLRFALCKKLYEYDHKTGFSSYTRVWFANPPTFDLDEKTQYGPMRFTDSIIRDDHRPWDSINVLRLKIMTSDVGYPIYVYGSVIVRDRLDFKCIRIFEQDEIDGQLLQSESEDLILTGSTRGLVFFGEIFFEINLKTNGNTEFSKGMLDVFPCRLKSKVESQTLISRLSVVQLEYSYVEKALEGTVEIKILAGPEVFYGKITASTTDVPNSILLYDSDVDGAVAFGDDRVIQLLRRVVAVSVNEMLVFNIDAYHGDRNANISSGNSKFTPLMKGADEDEITCGLYKMRVKVVWSTLFAP